MVSFSVSADTGTLLLSDTVSGGVHATQIVGNGIATISITTPQDAINTTLAASLGLQFLPATDFNSPVTLTTITNDQGFSSPEVPPADKEATSTAVIQVAAVYDPPSFEIDASELTVDEDAGPQIREDFASNFVPGPPTAVDEVGQDLTLTTQVTATTGHLAFTAGTSIDLATGTLTFTTALYTNGTATVAVTLTDDNGSLAIPAMINRSLCS